jgi:hypothetical protein
MYFAHAVNRHDPGALLAGRYRQPATCQQPQAGALSRGLSGRAGTQLSAVRVLALTAVRERVRWCSR